MKTYHLFRSNGTCLTADVEAQDASGRDPDIIKTALDVTFIREQGRYVEAVRVHEQGE